MMAIHWRRILKRWMIIAQNKNVSALLCVCLNPCNVRIACTFLLSLLCVQKKRMMRNIILFVILSITVFIIYLRHSIESYKCKDQDLKNLLKNLCNSYYKGNLTGNLCSSLCEEEQFHYVKCLNYKEGKGIVFGHWKGDHVVLKTKHLNEQQQLGFYDSGGQNEIVPMPSEFINMLRNTVENAFGIAPLKDDKKLLEKLWHANNKYNIDLFIKNIDRHSEGYAVQRSMMKSLWSLVQQDEYLFLQYFSENQFLPSILGSCGHIYAMEYAPSTGVLEPNIFQWSGTHGFTWQERADIARKMLDFVKSAEADYQEPLHLCDIKGSNFGISNNGVVKPIDVDTVFFKSKLKQIFKDTSCDKHTDCDFFDCMGICDASKNKCRATIMNNNLQAICTKIFSGSVENMFTGLLHAPPAVYRKKIEESLRKCKTLVGDGLEKYKEVFEELKNILVKSVS